MRRRKVFAAALCCLTPTFAVASGEWPDRPVRLVVPFAPGGTADPLARILANELAARLGQPFVIENRSGANGVLGGRLVAAAPPNGYTLLLPGWSMLVSSPHLQTDLGYDPLRSFAPVCGLAVIDFLLVVRPGLGVRNLDDFLEHARARPDTLTYGSSGVGSSIHLGAELFNRVAGLKTVHVPYRGSAPALSDLVAGKIDYMFDSGVSAGFVRDGQLVALGVTGTERREDLRDVPTFSELGYPAADQLVSRFPLLAPAGTPEAVVRRLGEHASACLSEQRVQGLIRAASLRPGFLGPEALRKAMADDFAAFGRLIRQLGIEAG